MPVRAVLFDLYGTLIHIQTDENAPHIYWAISQFLSYHRIVLRPEAVQEQYQQRVREQKRTSAETWPEMDAQAAWEDILRGGSHHFVEEGRDADGVERVRTRRRRLARELARLHRALSRTQLERYPWAKGLLKQLRGTFRLGVVSDAQRAFALPELRVTKIRKYFDAIAISGDLGYRKPDPRLFHAVCSDLGVSPSEAIFVGNDMFRDIFGAREAGLRTIWVKTDQGAQNYRDVRAEYDARDLRQVWEGIQFLCR
ncbi:HAD family hydrolase [Acidithiobacillus sp.]|uniref:HAD family hydrolase n=1 Tax=Acidithiobacillus sp. TaxID=1872118 RepID=UPI003D00639A